MLRLAVFVSSLAGALFVPADGAYTRCFHRDAGTSRIVDAALVDCIASEAPPGRDRAPAGTHGVFVADATGTILGRNAGLLGTRVLWMSDGWLFVASSRTAAEFSLLYVDDHCGGQAFAESTPYANLAIPVLTPTGTWDAFVPDGAARRVVPGSIWTGSACAKPCQEPEPCGASFTETTARPVRSIGPYPSYALPCSLVEK